MEKIERKPITSFKKRIIRRLIVIIFFALIIFALHKVFIRLKNSFIKKNNFSNQEVQIPKIEIQKEESIKKNEKIETYIISSGDIPADIFMLQGKFDANDIEKILVSSKNIYDFTNLKTGQKIRFYFDNEEKAKRIEYEKNTENIIIVERDGDNFKTKEEKINYEISKEIARGKIDDFFYIDGMEAGMQEATVLEVGDIFSFDIDFTTEIQVGDEFIIIYEKRTRDGKEAPDGKILAAKFVNSGKAYYAYYFDNNGNSNSTSTREDSSTQGGYYDNDGKLLERQFLRAPLSYRYISSGFTGARRHPITKKISAHYQIDYVAPSGTPVVASAHGIVSSAGWQGGWGNIIRLTHENGYTTHYGHLSAFAKGIKSGVKVNRGQIIGYVGSTGWSTGPHLDYGVKLNGTPINPLTMSLPKGAPLNEEQMKIFEETKKQFEDQLN